MALRGRSNRKFRLLPPPWRYQLYTSGYSEGALDWWATRLKLWRKGQQPKDAKLVTAKRKSEPHDLFVYFDNDAKVHAPFDAQTLRAK